MVEGHEWPEIVQGNLPLVYQAPRKRTCRQNNDKSSEGNVFIVYVTGIPQDVLCSMISEIVIYRMRFNISGFNVRGFHGLAVICESLVCENLDNNGYAQNNGQHPQI